MKTLLKKTWLLLFMALSCSCGRDIVDEQLSPLDKLKEGNKRFVKGQSIHPDADLKRLKALKDDQHPFAVVVGCSDSRVPPEIIFDQGLGDLFIIRTAGNAIGDYELGSIEYALEHLNCSLVVVLGHESCGAIKAFISSDNKRHQDHIQSIVDYIAGEKEEKAIRADIKNNPDLAVRANIAHGVQAIQNSEPVMKPLFENKKLKVIGAYYNLHTGEVNFKEQ